MSKWKVGNKFTYLLRFLLMWKNKRVQWLVHIYKKKFPNVFKELWGSENTLSCEVFLEYFPQNHFHAAFLVSCTLKTGLIVKNSDCMRHIQ